MQRSGLCLVSIVLLMVSWAAVTGAAEVASEMSEQQRWFHELLEGTPPLSFKYGGRDSAELLPNWQRTVVVDDSPMDRTLATVTFTDPETRLVVQVEAVAFRSYPAIEWTVYFRNGGTEDTPILSDVRALDLRDEYGPRDSITLHYAKGSNSAADDFAPLRGVLMPGMQVRLASFGGRSSDGYLPFFNLQAPGGGAIVAIGWTGQWEAYFSRNREGVLRVEAGMEGTHLKLYPGEQIRTPQIALVFWKGDDRMRGHNLLRRFILAHHTPTIRGDLIEIPVLYGTMGWDNEQSQLNQINRLVEIGLPIEAYWIDAGWYGDDNLGEWVHNTGNWYPSPTRFPNGLLPLSEALHAGGIDFGVWIEPERVMPGTDIYNNHPDWLLAPVGLPSGLEYQRDWRLLNLGNPEALEWAIEYVSSVIEELDLKIYRQDFNMHPLYYWNSADAPDRRGITQIRHVEGLYAFWDALRERHPDLLIDNCASGGRRIDLETISRSVPLWRSDFHAEATRADFEIGAQSQTYGLSFWVPLSGQGSGARTTSYAVRSTMTGGLILGGWSPWGINPVEGEKLLSEVKQVRPFFYGDYYPLSEYTLSPDAWMAYQFHRPDLGKGIVLAFRRSMNAPANFTFVPKGLDPDKTYEITMVDAGSSRRMTGEELATAGYSITLPLSNPYALLFTYREIYQ